MPISQSVLDEQKQPNVLLAEGYEFLCDVLQRFLKSALAERETFVLTRLDDGSYRVERVDRITARLARLDSDEQYSQLYRPLADFDWFLAVQQVVDINDPMTDREVAGWNRRQEGRALVAVNGDDFVGLIYQPLRMRSGTRKSLTELFPNGIGGVHVAMAEENNATRVEESFTPAKGLEAMQPVFERELAMATAVEPLEMALPAREDAEEASPSEDESRSPAFALSVPFHTDIRFANWLKPGQTRPLTVQLTQEKAAASMSSGVVNVGFVEEFTAEILHVHLDAPSFSERTDTWQKAVEVYSFQDSDKATFILTAGQEEGERQISIDFRHRGRLISNARFVVQVSSQEPVAAGPAATDALTFRQPPSSVEIPQFPPPPPDVEIRIRADGKRLTFELSSPHQAADVSNAPMGGVEMAVEPQAYMQERYDELNQWAGGQPADADVIADIHDRLTAIGNGLFLSLFPDKLKRAYWKLVKLREQGVLKSLHIVSDEPWIPWEMVKPVDMDEGEADDFLAEGWQISRWLAGPGQVDRLRIDTARLVAPDTDLTQVKREVDFFGSLPARRIAIGETLRQLAQVRQIGKEGVELLHFSTHGRLNAKSIDSSSILLENNTELRPDDLVGEAVFGLRKRRPLVFMNTCHGARMGFSLAGLGGWAGQMINQAKAGVFIGALWEVNDALAADFALRFYSELQDGQTLGAAFHTARQEIREKAPANSTWLAYTLYGDPNIQVGWGSEQ